VVIRRSLDEVLVSSSREKSPLRSLFLPIDLVANKMVDSRFPLLFRDLPVNGE
jgi:hypothetical protein